ncbi:MAG TPA: ATP-binding protein [Acidobacteriaceae bacterium]
MENGIRNAVRHAPQGSVICLSLSGTDEVAVIAVRDFGTGVPEESLARIFDPFFRVEKARDMKSGGSGLGLSIAKRAVLLHRGEIWADNAGPGLAVKIRL